MSKLRSGNHSFSSNAFWMSRREFLTFNLKLATFVSKIFSLFIISLTQQFQICSLLLTNRDCLGRASSMFSLFLDDTVKRLYKQDGYLNLSIFTVSVQT